MGLVRRSEVIHRDDCPAQQTFPPVPWPLPGTPPSADLRAEAAAGFLLLCTTCRPLGDRAAR